MAGRMTIDSGEVLATASRINQLNDELNDLLLDTQKRIHLLGNSFTGEAADATIAAFDGFAAKYFASYYEMLQRYVQFLRTSGAEGYSQTQKKNVGLANQLN